MYENINHSYQIFNKCDSQDDTLTKVFTLRQNEVINERNKRNCVLISVIHPL